MRSSLGRMIMINIKWSSIQFRGCWRLIFRKLNLRCFLIQDLEGIRRLNHKLEKAFTKASESQATALKWTTTPLIVKEFPIHLTDLELSCRKMKASRNSLYYNRCLSGHLGWIRTIYRLEIKGGLKRIVVVVARTQREVML